MRRIHICFCIGWNIYFAAAVASAQVHEQPSHWHAFWARVKLDFHRNNAYPEPFQHTDRQLVATHWFPYIAKGWQIENTLSEHHFVPQTQALTSSGFEKVRWIITGAPAQRRTIFVLRSPDGQITEARVDQVQRAVAQILPEGPFPDVVRTDVVPHGTPGSYLNEVWNKGQGAIAVPVLPAATGNSTSGT